MPLFAGLDDDGILRDTDAAGEHLGREGFVADRIGIVGFCFGGRVTFLVAARRSLGAAAGFYGGGIVSGRIPQLRSLVGEAASLRTPLLGLFGDEDQSIPVEDVETLRKALEATTVATDVVRYADAGHGFHCDQRPEFHPESAADAWSRTLAWFDRHLA